MLLVITFAITPITTSASTMVLTEEICDNRIDDDGDGLIDCMDPDCSGTETCWECITEFYQIHSNQYLVSLDPALGTYMTLATISGAEQINGAQFNPIDGHVYAPCKNGTEHFLGMLRPDGVVIDTGLDLPAGGIFYVGSIDAQGKMFVSNGAGIHTIDLNTEILEYTDLGINNPGVADFALDITRGLFYGITGSAKLKVLDPFTLNVDTYDLAGSINNDAGGYGAAWSSNDGSFFAYNNSSGKIYSVDVDNLTATLVLNATGNLSINDGFNCVLAPPPFETACNNGADDDGDGLPDCDDPDCYASNECTLEICDNGIDDDDDGWVDCSDSECFELEICLEICDNGIDDNNNGLIDSEDPQCGTTGGVTGGLESNRRLSDKIAQRNFHTRVKSPKNFYAKEAGLIPFEVQSDSKSSFEMSSFIPTDILNAFVAESSPENLINITNASEIAGADYYRDENRVASILGIYSDGGVYEHTKYICDRLDGARLMDISYLFAKGGNFISYELLTKEGKREYAVSFAARYDASKGFDIESHWNLHKFHQDTDYFNFQVWASSYPDMIVLLEALLDNMADKANLNSITHSEIPQVFIKQGIYNAGYLRLTFRNKIGAQTLNFNASVRRHEGGDLESIYFEIPIEGKPQESVVIKTEALYDLGASVSFEGSIDDEIFMADGAWGIDDQNPNALVNNFEVFVDERAEEEESQIVERSVSVSGEVKDYLNIYRSLDAKLNPKDLTEYNSLKFLADGKGTMEITLVKSSIENWENQFRTSIELSETNELFILNAEQFESNSEDVLSLEDVTMLVFTLLGDNQTFQTKTLNLSEVSFINNMVSSTQSYAFESQSVMQPNIVAAKTDFIFLSQQNDKVILNITDLLGRIVETVNFDAVQGKNTKTLHLEHLEPGNYFYTLESNNSQIGNGKFIKMQ